MKMSSVEDLNDIYVLDYGRLPAQWRNSRVQ
jgi:hypothetical protein